MARKEVFATKRSARRAPRFPESFDLDIYHATVSAPRLKFLAAFLHGMAVTLGMTGSPATLRVEVPHWSAIRRLHETPFGPLS
jgi:hypothetical protein